MRIDVTDRKSIMVELSKDDLSKSEMTYDQLDYSNPQTRELVGRILEKIRSETGLLVSDVGSLEVEVMPDSFGGCLMIFKEAPKKAAKRETALFSSSNINDLIDCSRAAKRAFGSLPDGGLYKSGDEYFLFIPDCPWELASLLCEYLSKSVVPSLRLVSVLERSVCLAEHSALSVLCGEEL